MREFIKWLLWGIVVVLIGVLCTLLGGVIFGAFMFMLSAVVVVSVSDDPQY